MAKNKIASAVIATAVATVSSPGAEAAAPIIASSDTEGAQAAPATAAEQSTSGSTAATTEKPAPAAPVTLTPIQKAAQFAGVPVDQVLDFKQYGDRYVVVTTSGRKLSRTPAEREADARAAAVAAEIGRAHV